MRRSRIRTLAALTMVATAVAGCQPPPTPPPPPPPPPPPMSPTQARAADVAHLRDVLQRYDLDLEPMPGHSGAEHRDAAAAALSQLATALELAYGPNPPPAFEDDLSVVRSAARTLALQSVPRSRMEGAETEAVHAAAAALGTLATRELFDDADLTPLVSAATDDADAARLSQGPLHDGDATAAFRSIQRALHRIADDLDERFPVPPPAVAVVPPAAMPGVTPATMPTTMPMPATMPAATATTMPSTMPATMPATMP
jgi:hypothetical protein